LVVAGQFKRGKTSLLNALLGQELLPVAVLPLTSVVTMLRFGQQIQAEIVFESGNRLPIPVEDVAAFVTESGNPRNHKHVSRAEVSCPNEYLGEGLVLIDTPGIGSVYSHNTQVTYDFLPRIDGAIFVTSPEPAISEVELQLLNELKDRAEGLFLVLNKADQVGPRELAEVLDFTRQAAKEASIFAVSAKRALEAKLRGDPALLESSGLPALEAELWRSWFTRRARRF
jgi:GTPase Era involved in 16S rRNA processing